MADMPGKDVVDLDAIPRLVLPEADDGEDDTMGDDKKEEKERRGGYRGPIPRLVLPEEDDGMWNMGDEFWHGKQTIDDGKEGEKRKAGPPPFNDRGRLRKAARHSDEAIADADDDGGGKDSLMPPPMRLRLRVRRRSTSVVPNPAALKNMRMREQEQRTFDFMLSSRALKFDAITCSTYANALKLPLPWTIPTWEQALQYEAVVEWYHELEHRIDDWLAGQLYDLRHELTALPLIPPKGTKHALQVRVKTEQLDRVIMRCRLSDAIRAFDFEHATCPHRIPEEADMLLRELHLREEAEVREIVEQKERAVREAIQMLDEIGEEAAAEEQNVPPIALSGLEGEFEVGLKRWPEWKLRLMKVAILEGKKFPKRYSFLKKGVK